GAAAAATRGPAAAPASAPAGAPTAAAAAGATSAPAAAATSAPAAGATPAAAAGAFKFAKRGEGPLHFVGWQYHPEVVEENVKIFKGMYNDDVNYELVAADYHPVAETKFI